MLLDKDFVKRVLSVPSYTGHEQRVREFILSWASEHSVETMCDDAGNVYLTKGSVGDGEYFPCLTSHMDTVHTKNIEHVDNDEPLEIIEAEDDVFYCSDGIGGDDKAGIAICLSLVEKLDVAKACFFVEEEPGCLGSERLCEDWFNDVGYCVAYDSPGYNRSAYACSGVMLFDRQFFSEHVEPLFSKFGVTNFRSEPCTDIENIRLKVGVACVNIGAGYHNNHTYSEFCDFVEMEGLANLGLEFINSLGMTRFAIPCSDKKYDFDNEEYKYFSTRFDEFGMAASNDYAEALSGAESSLIELYYEIMSICDENDIDFSLFEGTLNRHISNVFYGR